MIEILSNRRRCGMGYLFVVVSIHTRLGDTDTIPRVVKTNVECVITTVYYFLH